MPKKKNFRIHRYNGYVQNNYLVEYDDRILLIDGACRPDAEGIEKFVSKIPGRNPSDIKLIALTHCHPDHAGAAGILRSRHRIPIAAPHDIDHWYSGPGGVLQHISDTLQTHFMAWKSSGRKNRLYYSRKIAPQYKLEDGDTLPFFEDWKAISAPGHTSHNIMLFNEEAGILYISDTVIDSNGKFLPPVPVLFPENMKKTIETIKKIRPEKILLAHSSREYYDYNEDMFDEIIERIDRNDSAFIRFFYLLSKFTGEYRKHKEK